MSSEGKKPRFKVPPHVELGNLLGDADPRLLKKVLCLRLLVHDAKEVSVQAILIAHDQRRKLGEVAASKLGNFALEAHARLPRHDKAADHIRTTNEA